MNKASDDELAYYKLIPFNEFKNIFSENLNNRGDNNLYYRFLALEDFQRYFESYIYENNGLSKDEIEKIQYYMRDILCLKNENLEWFIKGIIPHRKVSFNTITDYKDNSLLKAEMEDAFFEILRTLIKGKVRKHHITWICEQGECYSPTAIADKVKRKGRVCAKIIENSLESDVNLLFEGNTLITEELDSESIYQDAQEQFDFGEIDSDHIMRVMKIKLLSIEAAKEKIHA
jgi:hypothetical protein